MENTRVEKYKKYRSSLISDGSPTLTDNTTSQEHAKLVDTLNTSTIPINEVYQSLEKDDKEAESLYQLELKKTKIKTILISVSLGLVAIALILFAIYAFK